MAAAEEAAAALTAAAGGGPGAKAAERALLWVPAATAVTSKARKAGSPKKERIRAREAAGPPS